jgi:peroxiredoxin
MIDNNLSFPALLDTDGNVSLDYGVSGIPVTFFIDKDGIIQATRLGSFSSADEIEDYLNPIMP